LRLLSRTVVCTLTHTAFISRLTSVKKSNWFRPLIRNPKLQQAHTGFLRTRKPLRAQNIEKHITTMSAMSAAHGSLRMLVDGGFVVLQPAANTAGKAETLSIDLNKGTVETTQMATASSTRSTEILGVVGMFQLQSCSALVVITGAQEVGVLLVTCFHEGS
jgi:hypothetical protein